GRRRSRSPRRHRGTEIDSKNSVSSCLRGELFSPTSAVILFYSLLVFLAADAEVRLGARFEALQRDLLLALFALTERALLDLHEGLLDLVEERLLAATEAKRERLKVLAGREIHLVREIVRVEHHVFVEGLLRLLDDLVALLFEEGLELLELDLVHLLFP